jgi:alpha-1,2-mannosyltransferase
MNSVARAFSGAIFGSDPKPGAERWSDPAVYVRIALLVILLSIVAGIVLRLTGYVGGAYSWFFFSSARDDSWFPMGLAYERAIGAAPGTLRDLFFVDHIKFQYPASSLLLYSALDLVGIDPTPQALNVLVWLSILGTAIAVYQICVIYIDKYGSSLRFSTRDKYVIAAAFAVATLFFYPIMIAWRLGQIQALLNVAFVLACLCWLTDRKLAAGALIGAVCLVKPQLSLFLIWALLRGQRQFSIGLVVAVACGLSLSLALYGWDNHIYYLEVLSFLSQHGEVFWDNTSVNGLVTGFYHPDEVLIWHYHSFPPYNPVTYALTMVSSVIIAGLALLVNRASPSSGSLLAFQTAGLSFTLASPIAWGHHYGGVIAMLAVVFLEIARQTSGARTRNYLLGWSACFLLFSNYWNITEHLAETPFAVLQNWRLFAVVGLLWMMYRLQPGAAFTAEGDARARPATA